MKLTKGEWFTLWRRRNNLTQVAAAAEFGVTEDVVRAWEHDTPPVKRPVPNVLRDLKLKPGEVLWIERRRAGLTLKQAAKRDGVSHVTRIKRERAGR
jgi:DNA-binding XRE family transcriptional regulator